MKKNIVEKIRATITKGSEITENNVLALMILFGKLLEIMKDDTKYLTIRFFRNWCSHIKITDSITGLRILAKINDTLIKVKNIK